MNLRFKCVDTVILSGICHARSAWQMESKDPYRADIIDCVALLFLQLAPPHVRMPHLSRFERWAATLHMPSDFVVDTRSNSLAIGISDSRPFAKNAKERRTRCVGKCPQDQKPGPSAERVSQTAPPGQPQQEGEWSF